MNLVTSRHLRFLKIYLTRLLCTGKCYRFWHNPAQASIFEEISQKNWTQISTCYNILILTSLLEFCMCMLYHSYPSKYILYFHFDWFFWCTYCIVFSVGTWLQNLSNILPKMQDSCLPAHDTQKERKNTFGCSVIFF